MKQIALLSLLLTACVDKTCPEPAVNDGNRCICPEGMEWTGTGCAGIPGWDAGMDVGPDTLVSDANQDTSVPDAATDPMVDTSDDASLPPSENVSLRFPWNGYYTGSPHVPDGGGHSPLRPRFVWELVPDADSYQIQIDDSCDQPATCDFRSTELDERVVETSFRAPALDVSTEAPVGTRYAWRVRACRRSACSDWSSTRYVNVGRVPTDTDGDGYPEVLVTEPELETGGVLRVYSGDGFFESNEPRSISSDGFGGVAAGDFDADGFSDVVVTNARTDRVTIHWGGLGGVESSSSRSFPVANFQVADTGDVDGDGFDDLVYGGSDGLTIWFGHPRSSPDRRVEVDGELRASGLRVGGDLDGDGFADIVANQVGSGLAIIDFRGASRSTGLTGTAFCVVDEDGDGFDDVALHTTQLDPRLNEVSVYRGGRGGLSSRRVPIASSATVFVDPLLGCGDFDGDGAPEFVISQRGELWIVASEGEELVPLPSGSGATNCHALGVGDTNSDGFDDLHCGDIDFRRMPDRNGALFSLSGNSTALTISRELLATSYSTLGADVLN